MSLILEALKKLDREKQVPERGFLVMAAAPWPSASHRSLPNLWLGLVVAMAAGGGIAYWLLRPAPAPAVVPAGPTPVAPPPDAAIEGSVDAPSGFPDVATANLPPAPATNASTTPTRRAFSPGPARNPVPPQDTEKPPQPAPDAPAVASAPPPLAPPFTLEAISLRDGSPIAVVNGRLIHEGDVTNGITVVKIGTESVELEIRGVRQIIRF